jgi:methionyl-tRNA synthetase
MLMSAGLPLPNQVVANGFLTVGGTKISKSLGNAIDPLELADRYGVDAVRYFLLREVPYGADGDFSEEKMKERYNGDLANGLGNFAARVLTLAEKESGGASDAGGPGLKVSKLDVDFQNTIDEMKRVVLAQLGEYKFNEALATIWSAISFGDRYVNEKKVWEIKNDKERVAALFNLVSLLEAVATALIPFMPESARKIAMAIERDGNVLKIKKPEILFPRLK